MSNRGPARTFGQDLMRGEHVVGGGGPVSADARTFATGAANGEGGFCDQVVGPKPRLAPGGGGGGCWLGGPKTASTDNFRKTDPGLTWVGGNRAYEDLDETSQKILAASSTGTSIFDPVLCELAYRWFCPPGGHVLDPFAGGSVRGIVAAKLGRPYTGVELRAEQVTANRAQAAAICTEPMPAWHVGDSREIQAIAPGAYDFVFSCPPYADLEVYSNDPRDLSTLPYPAFRAAYNAVVAAACALLKPDRFACFVVGDARGKDGCYYGLPGHTVEAFAAAGLRLYNEAVLVTAVGSLPIRITRQFEAGRKLGKTHQNLYIFVKGDPKRAAVACGAGNA